MGCGPVTRNARRLRVLRERRRAFGDIATAGPLSRPGVFERRYRSPPEARTTDEGLPVLFGPLFEFRPPSHTLARLDLRGTSGPRREHESPQRFRLSVRADLRFQRKAESVSAAGCTARWSRSGSAWRPVSPAGRLPAAADYRDYFEREGVSGMAYVQPARALRVEFSLSRDAERSVRATDPWSLFRNSDRWRRNPLVDDGHYFITGLQVDYDTRNERDRPTTGWMIRTRYEHLTSDDIAPVALPSVVRPNPPTGGGYGTDRLLIDARRYSRLTPGLQVNARLRADGWLAGGRLPVRVESRSGGPDLLPVCLPAYTCAPGVQRSRPAALCDRSIIGQVEVRTRLGLNWLPPARPRGTRDRPVPRNRGGGSRVLHGCV